LKAGAPSVGGGGRSGWTPADGGLVLVAGPAGSPPPATQSIAHDGLDQRARRGAGAQRTRGRRTECSHRPPVPGAGVPEGPDLRPEGRRATRDRRPAGDSLRATPVSPRVGLLVRHRGETDRADTAPRD